MRKIKLVLAAFTIILFQFSCTKTGESLGTDDGYSSPDGPGLSGVSGGAGMPGGGAGMPGGQAGVVTAGEWNDLANWNFWNTLLTKDTIREFPATWGFYTQGRISVELRDASNKLLHDAIVKVTYDGKTIMTRTSNDGKAELFPSFLEGGTTPASFNLSAEYKGQVFNLGTITNSQGTISRQIAVTKSVQNKLDIMFVVDATGSMSDEITYLKNELRDVINRADGQLPGVEIRMGSVFYRDLGDEYLTRPFAFGTSTDQLLNFINAQSAGGGGDFPEAVDEALKAAIQNQAWSPNAVNRLLFLVLDAPPHKDPQVLDRLKTAVTEAQKKGIRIIPVSASGIDWETEFLLRFLSIGTNSTYVFITNHSGIGNPHHTPTVGSYDVEYLNNLMVRLITKYGLNRD